MTMAIPSSPISRIPVEVLQDIFELSAVSKEDELCGGIFSSGCPLSSPNSTTRRLSHTSHYFREVSLSYGRLWSSFAIRPEDLHTPRGVQVLEELGNRRNGAQLYLALLETPQDRFTVFDLRILASLLQSCSGLLLDVHSVTLANMERSIGTRENRFLHTLCLWTNDEIQYSLYRFSVFRNCTNLRTYLGRFTPPMHKAIPPFAFAGLTSVVGVDGEWGGGGHIEQHLALFHRSPALVKADLTCSEFMATPVPAHTEPFTHELLQELRLKPWRNTDTLDSLLQVVTFPALKRLAVEGVFGMESVWELLQRSGHSLQSLEIFKRNQYTEKDLNSFLATARKSMHVKVKFNAWEEARRFMEMLLVDVQSSPLYVTDSPKTWTIWSRMAYWRKEADEVELQKAKELLLALESVYAHVEFKLENWTMSGC